MLLLCLAGFVQATRNPDRTFARLAMFGAILLIVGFTVFAIRGDMLRSSGMDQDDSGCGYARSC